jgi:Ser/Thr protein kinase RdoA (MazF antagonist)
VRWPPDHPAVTDPALARWSAGAESICPDAEVVQVLRYVPGRRVATRVRTGGSEAVLKIFASPRARGNHRRLTALASTDLVPYPLAVDETGHVGLMEFIDGTPLSADRSPDAAHQAGAAVRRLHDSGARLDRAWSVADELAQLRRTAGPQTHAAVEEAIRRWTPASLNTSVPSHRDCYPAQAVLTSRGVRLIDLDDAAMAPAGLDVGNFTAHLIKDEAAPETVAAFIEGYGEVPAEHASWERLTLARLAALAETRHGRPDDVHKLLQLLR